MAQVIYGTDIVLELQAWRDKAALNLTGANGLTVRLVKYSGATIDITPVVVDPVNGLMDCQVTAAQLNETGPWEGQLTGTESSGAAIAGSLPSFYVHPRL